MDCWRVGRAGRRDESRLYVFLQINLVSHCYWMLCSVGCLQIPMTGRRTQTGAATVVRFTRAPLQVDVCRPDIAFSTRSFFLAERACVPAVFDAVALSFQQALLAA